MPGTDLHAELLKTKRKSKAKLNIDIDLSLEFKLDKINSDRICLLYTSDAADE